MLTFHLLSIVTHGLALNITIQTYAGSVDFGLIADKKAVPHLQELADALVDAFEQARTLYAMAVDTGAVPSVKTPARGVAKETKKKKPSSKTRLLAPAKRMKAVTVAPGDKQKKDADADGKRTNRKTPTRE
jgi:hypothetical protein